MKNPAREANYFIMCILTASNICYAEDQLLPPSDVDLKSAYCLTIQRDNVNTSNTVWKNLKERGTNPKLTDYTHQKLGEAEDRFHHLQLYLIPRLEYIDANGLTGAINRAKQDILFISNESTIACGRQCSSGAEKDMKACVNKCAPEQFNRLRSCDELSWLPF